MDVVSVGHWVVVLIELHCDPKVSFLVCHWQLKLHLSYIHSEIFYPHMPHFILKDIEQHVVAHSPSLSLNYLYPPFPFITQSSRQLAKNIKKHNIAQLNTSYKTIAIRKVARQKP